MRSDLRLLFALWAANGLPSEWKNYRVVFNEAVTGLFEGAASDTTASAWARSSACLAPTIRAGDRRGRISADTPIRPTPRQDLAGRLTGRRSSSSAAQPERAAARSNDRDIVPTIATEPSALQNIADTAKAWSRAWTRS